MVLQIVTYKLDYLARASSLHSHTVLYVVCLFIFIHGCVEDASRAIIRLFDAAAIVIPSIRD